MYGTAHSIGSESQLGVLASRTAVPPASPPLLRINPLRLPSLLPLAWVTREVLPYADLGAELLTAPSNCPPWSFEVEAFYQLIHTGIWPTLDEDDRVDEEALREYRRQIALATDSPAPDSANAVARWVALLESVLERRRARWERLYALRVARQLYLSHKLKENPHWERYDAVHALPGTLSKPFPIRRHSLWPVPNPPMTEKVASTLTGAKDFDKIDWQRYRMPLPSTTVASASALLTSTASRTSFDGAEPAARPVLSPSPLREGNAGASSAVDVSAAGARRRALQACGGATGASFVT